MLIYKWIFLCIFAHKLNIENMSINIGFPRQALSYKQKTDKWRRDCVDFCDSKTYANFSPCRKSVKHKIINYNLLDGKLNMEDLQLILNPANIKADYLPEKIQHYPILNSKLNVLKGEEFQRVFDYHVVVTNPNAISEIEENKKQAFLSNIQQWIQDESQNDEQAANNLQRITDYMQYDWQDMRELLGNCVLNHYNKEYNFKTLFNEGFTDAMTVGEEMYLCSIVAGEPMIERLDPNRVRILRNGYDNKIENADCIIIEDYWSTGRIIDTYHESLSQKDIKRLDSGLLDNTDTDDTVDPLYGVYDGSLYDDYANNENIMVDSNKDDIDENIFVLNSDGYAPTQGITDMYGNVRVLRCFWKSKRKIKKVKYYDENGEEQFNLYNEDYIIDKDKGEEEEIMWINQAWEGTKIGNDIYVNMQPMACQFNTLTNPSRCHFGIIGTIYNTNNGKPFSMVDMMKPYSYLYDVIHERLNTLIAKNWGMLVSLDLSKKPANWSVDKWMYFAKTLGLYVQDSFNEGLKGAATGKLAGAMNNASTGVINANTAQEIMNYIQLLQYIKDEMSEAVGISKQREGQISNRETVGGVERSTLQSSYITEWLFIKHEDTKKRVLTAFLELCKIAMMGTNRKFDYILPNGIKTLLTIDGDKFAENDYGLVVDNSDATQKLNQQLDTLAQAAIQNQTLSFTSIMKLYTSASIAEKINMIRTEEQNRQQQMQEQQEQQNQLAQQQLQQKQQSEEEQREQEYKMNQENNDTKILIAQINAESKANDNQQIQEEENPLDRDKFNEEIRQFNERLAFDKDKLSKDLEVKKQQINNRNKLK